MRLIAVADYLQYHHCPIDYQRRRTLYYTALLPEAAWPSRHSAQPRGSYAPTPAPHSESPLRGADRQPHRTRRGTSTTDLRRCGPAYPTRLTPIAAAALHMCTSSCTALVSPTLTWQPPLRLLDGLVLPGADPDIINIAALHHLIEDRQPLSTVARQLNSTPEAVGHVLTLHPATVGPPSTTPALSAWPPNCHRKSSPPSTAAGESHCATSPPATTSTVGQLPPSRSVRNRHPPQATTARRDRPRLALHRVRRSSPHPAHVLAAEKA